MAWDSGFLTELREETLRRIVRGQLQIGGVWQDAVMIEKTIDGANINVVVQSRAGINGNLTAIRLISVSGAIAATESISAQIEAEQGAHIKFTFPLIAI